MENKLKRKYFFTFLLLFTMTLHSQDYNNKWAFGIGSGALLYSKDASSSIGYRYTELFPRIVVSRYLFKNITIAGAFSKSINEDKKYITYDGEIRYDFGTSENLIHIYALIGGSLIDTKHVLPLLNFGAGGSLRVYEGFGLFGQLTYKYNHIGFNSQGSHIFASAGLIYRFKLGSGSSSRSRNNRSKGSRVRLWEMKH